MWKVKASDVGGSVSGDRRLRNSLTRASSQLFRSDCLYILPMNVSADLTVSSFRGSFPRLSSRCCSSLHPKFSASHFVEMGNTRK